MMHRSFVLLLAGTSFVSLATGVEAKAADAPAPVVNTDQAVPVTTIGSQDIVVTATKRPEVLLDVPLELLGVVAEVVQRRVVVPRPVSPGAHRTPLR